MRHSVLLLGAIALLSCSNDHPPAAAPTSSSAPPPATSTTATSIPAPTTSSPLSHLTGCPDPGPVQAPDPARPRYVATADVDVASSTVTGSLTVRFTPDLDTDEVVFRLWPNAPPLAADGVHEDVGPVSGDDGALLPSDRP